jgi:hypothetical protein
MKLFRNVNNGFVEMIFGPRWTYIATVRSFFQNFLAITLANTKWADVISMAASELLENAVKYAADEGTKVSLEHLKEEKKLYLCVENFASPEQIKILKSQVQEINEGNPQEIYLQKMQEAALRTDGGSQLGLARIRYESDSKIVMEVEGDLVRVAVTFSLT